MGAIKVDNYRNITGFYDGAQGRLEGVADYYYNAALEIVLLQEFDPEIDLLVPFYQAYLAADSAYTNPPTAVITAVAALQVHILNRARTDASERFASINEWLDAGGTQGTLSAAVGRSGETGDGDLSFRVERRFATMSSSAGYAIASGNSL